MEFDEDWTEDDEWDAGEPDDASDEYDECPFCGADVYELADQCPTCGSYITHSTSPFSQKPWWWVALGLIGMLALAASLLLSHAF